VKYDENHFRAAIEEIKRHLEDTETSKLGHWAAARRYERVHKLALGLPATVLSIVLAWLVSSQTRTVLPAEGIGSDLVHNIPVFISLVVSLLSGMTAFLNLSDLAIRHRTAAENLNALWRNCRNWETDFPDATLCEAAVKAVQGYRARLNDINGDAPQIPKWAWKATHRQREEGSVSYNGEQRETAPGITARLFGRQ
jgi:hypothetical protein